MPASNDSPVRGASDIVDLRSTMEFLASMPGQLVSTKAEVDPYLEITEFDLGLWDNKVHADYLRDVLIAARDGATVADIAARLVLSEGTVRNHLSTAIQKLEARNRAEATRRTWGGSLTTTCAGKEKRR